MQWSKGINLSIYTVAPELRYGGDVSQYAYVREKEHTEGE